MESLLKNVSKLKGKSNHKHHLNHSIAQKEASVKYFFQIFFFQRLSVKYERKVNQFRIILGVTPPIYIKIDYRRSGTPKLLTEYVQLGEHRTLLIPCLRHSNRSRAGEPQAAHVSVSLRSTRRQTIFRPRAGRKIENKRASAGCVVQLPLSALFTS